MRENLIGNISRYPFLWTIAIAAVVSYILSKHQGFEWFYACFLLGAIWTKIQEWCKMEDLYNKLFRKQIGVWDWAEHDDEENSLQPPTP